MSRAGVREAVSSCLLAVLGAGDEEERRAAEEEMKVLEVTEGSLEPAVLGGGVTGCTPPLPTDYGVALAELTASAGLAMYYRQLASVLLRQYVESHWSNLSHRFCEPVPGQEVRAPTHSQLSQSSLVGYVICCRQRW